MLSVYNLYMNYAYPMCNKVFAHVQRSFYRVCIHEYGIVVICYTTWDIFIFEIEVLKYNFNLIWAKLSKGKCSSHADIASAQMICIVNRCLHNNAVK